MPSLLIKSIRQLLQVADDQPGFRKGKAMAELPAIDNAWLLIEDGLIKDFGQMDTCPERADEIIDALGRMVLPSWIDSHTHLVFAATREEEFEDRIKGLSYTEIAAKGGGILNSARKLQAMDESLLYDQALERLSMVRRWGTGAIEIKSGYGLTVEAELKMLRVIRRLKEATKTPIRSTFLGAHAYPGIYKDNHQGYINLIIEQMIPRIVDEGLADYIDLFCEKGFFSVADAEKILEAGIKRGLKPRIHTNQFNSMGGIKMAICYDAISVDHLEVLNESEIQELKQSEIIPTLLPTAPFFLNDPYPPARKMIDEGLGVVLATDYNPGSSPSGRMGFVLSLACVKLRMLPSEAINAITVNAAHALEWSDQLGSIRKGNRADIIITKPCQSIAFLPYNFGGDMVWKNYVGGQLQI